MTIFLCPCVFEPKKSFLLHELWLCYKHPDYFGTRAESFKVLSGQWIQGQALVWVTATYRVLCSEISIALNLPNWNDFHSISWVALTLLSIHSSLSPTAVQSVQIQITNTSTTKERLIRRKAVSFPWKSGTMADFVHKAWTESRCMTKQLTLNLPQLH